MSVVLLLSMRMLLCYLYFFIFYSLDHHVEKLQMTADKCFLPFLSLFLYILTSGLLPGQRHVRKICSVLFFLLVKKPFLSYLPCVLISSSYLIVASEFFCYHYYYIVEITDHSIMVCVSDSLRTS